MARSQSSGSGAADHPGEWRPIYTAILHEPEYLALSPPARCLLIGMKLSLGTAGIGRLYREQLTAMAGVTGERAVSKALDQLVAHGWIETEPPMFWIVNGYRFERPNANMRKGAETHVRGLGKSPLADRWLERYANHSETIREPFPNHSETMVSRDRNHSGMVVSREEENRKRIEKEVPPPVSHSSPRNSSKLTRAQMDRLKAGIIGDMPPATDPMKAAEVDAEVRRQKAMAARALKEQTDD